jgi:hypothetical protein
MLFGLATNRVSFPLRVASIAIGRKLTIEPDRLLFGDRHPTTPTIRCRFPIMARANHSHRQRRNLIDGGRRKPSRAGSSSRRDRNRRRRLLSDAVRS